MKELKFLCVQPDDTYYTWQCHLWIESLRKLGLSNNAIILIFIPNYREKNPKWQQLIDLYPEAEFVFYKDVDNVSKYLGIYIPVLRPYCLMRYFKEHPDMKEKAVFYCDCDVIFTEKFDISKYIDDDVCYLSDANSYINASYFDSKTKDVLPEKLEEYKTKDVLGETCSLVGITREIAEKHNLHSGGAQYLLKNIDGAFWEKVMMDCISIRVHLMNVNKAFFANESKGFQSWCADMWAVLWNLWEREQETKNIEEMQFSWASDLIEKLEKCSILHNAGITGDDMGGGEYQAFYKGKYHLGKNPFDDPYLQIIYNSPKSKKRCTHYYVSQLIELNNKYKLKY